MNNTYIFIIWNKALFCEERIIDDLSNSFTILKKIYIQWDKDKFKDNLKALYGYKATNLDYKISCIGKGKFCLLLVEDPNPSFENKDNELINTNVYNKKWLYRKWTAGGFRIHSSLNYEETSHDLTVLFGPDFSRTLKHIDDNLIVNNNKYNVSSLMSLSSFEKTIKTFDINSICYTSNNEILILCNNKTNILMFVTPSKKINNNEYEIFINNKRKYFLTIFGVFENEIPKELLKSNLNFIDKFFKQKKEYISYINDEQEVSSSLNRLVLNSNLKFDCKTKNIVLSDIHISFYQKLLSFIKYYYVKCIYGIRENK